MADAMIKKPVTKSEDELLELDEIELKKIDDKKETSKGKSGKSHAKNTGGTSRQRSSKTTSSVESNSRSPKEKVNNPNDSNNNNGIMTILAEIRANQIETNKKVENVVKRVDDLYNEYETENDYDDYDEGEGDEDYNSDEPEDTHEKVDKAEPSTSAGPKRKTETETRFSKMKKLRSGEKCDSAIDENLAESITEIFRKGISEERFKELMKSDKAARPENCDGLVAVQTNQTIWNSLFQTTKTNDNKMRSLQSILVKGATILAKVLQDLDKENKTLNNNNIDNCCNDAMDALALLGQANYKLCLTRREFMKRDADERYIHLFTESTPIDKFLFGCDVSKTLTDIGICNRISKKIEKAPERGSYGNYGYRQWTRRGGRGRDRLARGGRVRRRMVERSEDSKNSNRWSNNNYC